MDLLTAEKLEKKKKLKLNVVLIKFYKKLLKLYKSFAGGVM